VPVKQIFVINNSYKKDEQRKSEIGIYEMLKSEILSNNHADGFLADAIWVDSWINYVLKAYFFLVYFYLL